MFIFLFCYLLKHFSWTLDWLPCNHWTHFIFLSFTLKYSQNVLLFLPLKQKFTNFHVKEKHIQNLLKCSFPVLILKEWHLKIWHLVQEYKILTNIPGDYVIGDPETNIWNLLLYSVCYIHHFLPFSMTLAYSIHTRVTINSLLVILIPVSFCYNYPFVNC